MKNHTFYNWILLIFSLLLSIQNFAQTSQKFSEKVLFKNGTFGYACYRIPAIITAKNGDLLAFAEGRVHGCGDFGDVDIIMRRSADNGLTWSKQEVIAENKTLQAGNPAPVLDIFDTNFSNGRIFLFYNTGTAGEHEVRQAKGLREVWYKTSVDHGKTWSKGTNISEFVHKINRPNYNKKYTAKEDWRTHAVTPGHAIQLKKGKYKGRIYVPANHSAGEPQKGFNEYRAYGFYSDNHGKTWQISEEVPIPSSNESIAVELSDGRLMQNIRQQNGGKKLRLVAISKDGGATWSETYWDKTLISPVCQASILSYTSPDDKELLLFSNPASKKRRENMTVRASFDDGKNWIFKRSIRSGESAYSDLVQLTNREIGLLYEHGNNGGIYFAQFNYTWLLSDANNTNNKWVKKRDNKNAVSDFDFQLTDPIIESSNTLFEEKSTVSLNFDFEGTNIYYTLDGSLPTEKSLLYQQPFDITQSCILKVKAFHKSIRSSNIISQEFVKIDKRIIPNKISIHPNPAPQYKGNGATSLFDLKRGGLSFQSTHWMGFEGKDAIINIIFSKKTPLHQLTVSTLSNTGAWIFPPKEIEIWTSQNGIDYQLIKKRKNYSIEKPSHPSLLLLKTELDKRKTKFLKIVLKNIGQIPDWHEGKGKKAWLFVDELVIE